MAGPPAIYFLGTVQEQGPCLFPSALHSEYLEKEVLSKYWLNE